jgi:excisionase family DNA binding protein
VNVISNGGRDGPVDRITVTEAADLLGVTQSAIRKRIQRGTIPWDKDEEGRIFVYVDPSEASSETAEDKSRDTAEGQSRDELLEVYREQVDFLRRELERKDAILLSLTQRIPELDAASEPRESGVSASEGRGGADDVPPEPEKPVSWWRRLFGG